MRILFVSSWFPVPADNGSKIRVLNLLRSLGRAHEVTLLSFVEPDRAATRHGDELAFCAHVETVPARAFEAHQWRWLPGLLTPTPRSLRATFEPRMTQRISAHVAAGSYDVVVASQLRAAHHLPNRLELPAVFEEVELGVPHQGFASAPDNRRRLRHGLTWLKHRLYLAHLLRRFSACTVVSATELSLLRAVAPDAPRPTLIPNALDLAGYARHFDPTPNTLVYAGALSYTPNHEAVAWFLREVFPTLRRAYPALQLTLTGDPAGRVLPSADGVVQSGWVSDVLPHVGSAWASIVPLRTGGGTRLKVLESMALGTPVISTSKGVEGLAVVDGQHALIADTPAAFISAVERLLRDPALRARLAENAKTLMREHYDWEQIAPTFLDLVESVAAR